MTAADDVAGEITVRLSDEGSYWSPNNQLIAMVEQDLGVRKFAAWVPVTREIVADQPAMSAVLDRAIDQYLRPWKHPDSITWPAFDPFPTLTRYRRLSSEWRDRARDAWSVLTGKASIEGDDW